MGHVDVPERTGRPVQIILGMDEVEHPARVHRSALPHTDILFLRYADVRQEPLQRQLTGPVDDHSHRAGLIVGQQENHRTVKVAFLDLVGGHQEHTFFKRLRFGGRRHGDRQKEERQRYNPAVDHLPRCTLSR